MWKRAQGAVQLWERIERTSNCEEGRLPPAGEGGEKPLRSRGRSVQRSLSPGGEREWGEISGDDNEGENKNKKD
jgi:hypothetical protein